MSDTDDLAFLLSCAREGRLVQALTDRPDLVRPELAEQARLVAREATERRDGEGAVTAYSVAETLLAATGQTAQSLEMTYQRLQVFYLVVETPERYQEVRQALLQTAESAQDAGAGELAGRCAILAADCSFWAADASAYNDAQPLLLQTLRDITVATSLLAGVAPVEVERLASTAAAALSSAGQHIWIDEPLQYQALVRQVVAEVDRWLPQDAAFEGQGGSTKRAHVAVQLAAALTHVGAEVDDRLVQRLTVALELARSEGDDEGWRQAAQGLLGYAGDRLDPDQRRDLRDRALAAELGTRRPTRSRLARLLASAHGDEVVGLYLVEALEAATPDPQDVYRLVEAASARTLLDGLQGLLTTPSDDACTELEQQIVATAPEVDDSPLRREMRLVSELPIGSTPEERASRLQLVRQLEQRYAELGAGFTGVADPVSLAEVQALLGPQELMVRYVLPYHALHPAYLPSALVITRDDAQLVSLAVEDELAGGFTGRLSVDGRAPVDASALGNAVVGARLRVARGTHPANGAQGDNGAGDPLGSLYDMVVAPVLATGLAEGRDHWVVVPQRSLHVAPWMALRSGQGRWLLDDAAVSIAPSASVWAALRRRSSPPPVRLAALADPVVGYAGLPQLPGARQEAESVRDAWLARGAEVALRLGPDATFAELVAMSPTADVVHLATHGSFPDTGALFGHRLLLSQDVGHSGSVTADAIRTLELGTASCAVLSICSGGAYRVGPGDEPYGLVPAFLESGAGSVIAAGWEVDDDHTRELMGLVAPAIPRVGPVRALRDGVLAMRDRHGDSVLDHTAFVCVGDPAVSGWS